MSMEEAVLPQQMETVGLYSVHDAACFCLTSTLHSEVRLVHLETYFCHSEVN